MIKIVMQLFNLFRNRDPLRSCMQDPLPEPVFFKPQREAEPGPRGQSLQGPNLLPRKHTADATTFDHVILALH